MKIQITKDQAYLLMSATKGTIFTVAYTKKDGSTRVLNGRSGVTKGVNGNGLKYDPAKKGLLTVYDIQAKGYRTVNLNTVMNIRFKGVSIDILRDDSFDYRSN